jgi:hypothetical protein
LKASTEKGRGFFVAATITVLVVGFLSAAIHPASSATQTPTGLIVPLYAYPTNPTWNALIQAKESDPDVPIIAIINPDSGPGSSSDPTYVAGIASLQSAGISVVGYVPTGYASVSLSTVEASATEYKAWYHVNGLFFDQMSNSPSEAGYYSSASLYAASIGLGLTIGNPGTSVPSTFVGAVSILVIYESPGFPSVSTIASSTMGDASPNFAMISYDVSSPTQTYLQSVAQYASYVYFTDGQAPDPYTGILPSFLGSLMTMISSMDSPSTTTSTTTTGAGPDLTILSQNTAGSAIVGYFTALSGQGGDQLATGYTPANYALTSGVSYTVTVSGYGSCSFDYWQDTKSADQQRTIAITSNAQLTAVYNCGTTTTGTTTTSTTTTSTTTTSTTTTSSASPGTLTVQSVDLNGNAIAGLYAVVSSSSGAVLQTGYTPLRFEGVVGAQYAVSVANYGSDVFNHWGSGSTSPIQTLTLGQSTVVTAYYATGATPATYPIMVNSYDLSGNSLTGLWVEVQSSGGAVLASGFTPFVYTGTAAATYSVTVGSFGSDVFSHWSTGSTDPTDEFALTQAMVLSAYYSTG